MLDRSLINTSFCKVSFRLSSQVHFSERSVKVNNNSLFQVQEAVGQAPEEGTRPARLADGLGLPELSSHSSGGAYKLHGIIKRFHIIFILKRYGKYSTSFQHRKSGLSV